MAIKTVTTENELLSMISDMQSPYGGKTQYVVKIDITKWDQEDKTNARWIQGHPRENIKIQEVKHAGGDPDPY